MIRQAAGIILDSAATIIISSSSSRTRRGFRMPKSHRELVLGIPVITRQMSTLLIITTIITTIVFLARIIITMSRQQRSIGIHLLRLLEEGLVVVDISVDELVTEITAGMNTETRRLLMLREEGN